MCLKASHDGLLIHDRIPAHVVSTVLINQHRARQNVKGETDMRWCWTGWFKTQTIVEKRHLYFQWDVQLSYYSLRTCKTISKFSKECGNNVGTMWEHLLGNHAFFSFSGHHQMSVWGCPKVNKFEQVGVVWRRISYLTVPQRVPCHVTYSMMYLMLLTPLPLWIDRRLWKY